MMRPYLLTLLLCACVCGCASPNADYTITRKPAGPPLVGFGAQMNAQAYHGHNWGEGEADESNIADYEHKVLQLRPQHVRVFVQPEWWTGGTDSRDSVIRTISLAQRAGATVNLTFWHGPYPDMRRQMRDFARMIRELRTDHGFTNIKYVTIQNEPNSFNMPMDRYNRIYWTFDEEARAAGIRDDIQLIGGDLLSTNQAAWFRNLSDHLAPILDGYSVHMYQDYWDPNQQLARVTEVPLYVNNLPPQGRKPIYLMEFGLRGMRSGNEEPGKHRDGTPLYGTPESAMLNGWRMMEALNRGYVAMVWWDLADLRYEKRRMSYGLIGEPSKGWPLKPGYYLMYLFTHTTQPGWRALQVQGGSPETLVSATGSKKDVTVYALNRSDMPRRVVVAGLPRHAVLRELTWNGRGDGKLVDSGSLQTSLAGAASLNLPPMSITALTSAGLPAQ
jgi:hypothetical protein